MKYFLFIFILFASTQIFADEVRIPLNPPSDFVAQLCPSPLWHASIHWKGVVDKRPNPVMGIQEKKGEVQSEVLSQVPLEEIYSKAFKQLFPACGLSLSGGETQVQVEIEQFSVSSEKKFMVSKGLAQSNLIFHLQNSDGSVRKIEVGYDIENKKNRQSKLKGITLLMEELLFESLKATVQNKSLRNAF